MSSEEYKKYIANQVRNNQIKYLDHTSQPEALSTTQYYPKIYGGKPLRNHPLAGYTIDSEGPSTLYVDGPNLMNRSYQGNIGDIKPDIRDILKGAGFWGDVGHELKSGLSKGAKAVFHDVIVPVGTSMAKDYVKSKMGGKRPRGRPPKHYVHHDVRMIEPAEHHKRVKGAGFWKDFGDGFVKGVKGTTKLASKILPIATMVAPELAPLTGAVMATNRLINKGSGRPRGRPRKNIEGGNKALDSIKKGFKAVGRVVAPVAKDIFHNVIVPVGTNMAKDYVKSKMGGRRKKCIGGASELYPPAVMRGGAKSGGARSTRGALIKKVMAKHGCTLGQASKYIKENNLI